ncbi:MAG: Plug domain-containing protein, partial [Cyanobacteria bacterium P01_C01_bin.118]
MASIKIQHCLWIVGLASLVISVPAIAKVTEDQPETFSKQAVSNLSETEPPIENIPVSTPKLAQASVVTSEEDTTLTDEESDNVIRIIVTAQRREEDVQDVPISITALNAQQIEDADIDTFRGVADNTPNYTVFDGTGVRFFDFYSVRGLSNFNFASRDAVGFFIDGVPFDYGAFLTQN